MEGAWNYELAWAEAWVFDNDGVDCHPLTWHGVARESNARGAIREKNQRHFNQGAIDLVYSHKILSLFCQNVDNCRSRANHGSWGCNLAHAIETSWT